MEYKELPEGLGPIAVLEHSKHGKVEIRSYGALKGTKNFVDMLTKVNFSDFDNSLNQRSTEVIDSVSRLNDREKELLLSSLILELSADVKICKIIEKRWPLDF